MDGTTGVMEIVTRDEGTKRFNWNGHQPDRDAARAAFEAIVAQGGVLATVIDSPHQATQVRTFDEVEEIERERGTVTVAVSPQLIGG